MRQRQCIFTASDPSHVLRTLQMLPEHPTRAYAQRQQWTIQASKRNFCKYDACEWYSRIFCGLVCTYLSIKCTPLAVSTIPLISPGFSAKAACSNSFCMSPALKKPLHPQSSSLAHRSINLVVVKQTTISQQSNHVLSS